MLGARSHGGVSFVVALLFHRHVLVAPFLLLFFLSRPLDAAALWGTGIGHHMVSPWRFGGEAGRRDRRSGYGRVENALLQIGNLDAGGSCGGSDLERAIEFGNDVGF